MHATTSVNCAHKRVDNSTFMTISTAVSFQNVIKCWCFKYQHYIMCDYFLSVVYALIIDQNKLHRELDFIHLWCDLRDNKLWWPLSKILIYMKWLIQCISFSRNRFEKPQLGPPLDLSVYGLRHLEMRANDKIFGDLILRFRW